MTPKQKTCFKCGEAKDLSAFYKHSAMADGRLNKCKECTKLDARKHRGENLEKVRAYDRQRANLPHRVKAREEYQASDAGRLVINRAKKTYISKNPQKRTAHIKLRDAVRSGVVKKPAACWACGNPKVEAHHFDYSLPLVVSWLCKKCHTDCHKITRELEVTQ